jgi:hypothetical protein
MNDKSKTEKGKALAALLIAELLRQTRQAFHAQQADA